MLPRTENIASLVTRMMITTFREILPYSLLLPFTCEFLGFFTRLLVIGRNVCFFFFERGVMSA